MKLSQLFVGFAVLILGGCQWAFDIGQTEVVPAAAVTIRADGLAEAVQLRLTADGVDEVMSVDSDGDHAFVHRASPSYAVTLVGGPPCALGANASGLVAGSDVVVDLACISSTQLTSLHFESLTGLDIALDTSQRTYEATFSELLPFTRARATSRGSRATITIAGVETVNGQSSSPIALDGTQSITINVDHPVSAVLRSTYVINFKRRPLAHAYFAKAFPAPFDALGWSVATDGVRMVVGAPNEASATDPSDTVDASKPQSGAAYVFVRSGESWAYEGFVKAPNADVGDQFGIAVAIDGDRLVVGAQGERSGSTDMADNSLAQAGAAYVYRREGAAWVFERYLKSPTPVTTGLFGTALALQGDTVVVGAWNEPYVSGATTLAGSGLVHVFRRTGTTWVLEATLPPDLTTGAGDSLGYSVAISGDRIAAGALDGNTTVSAAGAVSLYRRTGTSWAVEQQLVPADGSVNDFFGASVALDGTTLAVAAPHVLSSSGQQTSEVAGAAYVFDLGATGWTQTAKVVPSNGDPDDEFGRGIALRGGVLAVSAFREAGSSSGIASPSSDNAATDAGAVYLYLRDAGSWTQRRYIKGLATDPLDGFGTSIALAPNGVLAVGASGESSSTASDPTNNSLQSSGACFLLQ